MISVIKLWETTNILYLFKTYDSIKHSLHVKLCVPILPTDNVIAIVANHG